METAIFPQYCLGFQDKRGSSKSRSLLLLLLDSLIIPPGRQYSLNRGVGFYGSVSPISTLSHHLMGSSIRGLSWEEVDFCSCARWFLIFSTLCSLRRLRTPTRKVRVRRRHLARKIWKLPDEFAKGFRLDCIRVDLSPMGWSIIWELSTPCLFRLGCGPQRPWLSVRVSS